MTAQERSELSGLREELEKIRQGFLQVAEKCHDAIAWAPQKELDLILASLDQRRRELGSRYRTIRSRMGVLGAEAA